MSQSSAGEASIDIARDEHLLDRMHDARFTPLFLDVESPDPDALAKIVDSLRTAQERGIEVILGIIFGFDTLTGAG